MAWAKNGTPDTLGSAGDTLSISDLTSKKFNVFLSHIFETNSANQSIEFNGNTNSVYAERSSKNGATDATATSQADITIATTGNFTQAFVIGYVINISSEEKLVIGFQQEGGTGAAGAPNRSEFVGKFVPSPDADITQIDINNGGSGDYSTDSNLSAIGTD